MCLLSFLEVFGSLNFYRKETMFENRSNTMAFKKLWPLKNAIKLSKSNALKQGQIRNYRGAV